jgi:hypothetical protein
LNRAVWYAARVWDVPEQFAQTRPTVTRRPRNGRVVAILRAQPIPLPTDAATPLAMQISDE